MLKGIQELEALKTSIMASFENLFGEKVSSDEVGLWLAEYGRRVIEKVLRSLSHRDDIGEPLSYFRAALKSEVERQGAKGKGAVRVSNAYETHLKHDNELLRIKALTNREYDERRRAWKENLKIPHQDKVSVAVNPIGCASRREREKERREWCEYWGEKLKAEENEHVIEQMLAAIPQGARDMLPF